RSPGRSRTRRWRGSNRSDCSASRSRTSSITTGIRRCGGSQRCIKRGIRESEVNTQMEKDRVGVIGCGAVNGADLGMAKNFPVVEIASCADLDRSRAEAAARNYGIPKPCSVDELLADPSIEIVLNLTVPKAHVPIALRAIEAGKHTYAEKPLG